MPNRFVTPYFTVGYNRSDNDDNELSRVSRFHFPSKENNEDLFIKWINVVPRKEWTPSKNSVVCEKHIFTSRVLR